MNLIWKLFALVLASSPGLVNWLIKRAQQTPYTHIPSRDGKGTYMYRWWLFNPYAKDEQGNDTPARWSWLPSIRIHHIRLPDVDRDLHDHPWNARTIILRGWYTEELDGLIHSQFRGPGYTGRLLFGQYHRIEAINTDGVYTLFFTWKLQGVWGFKVNGQKVPHYEYLGREKQQQERA